MRIDNLSAVPEGVVVVGVKSNWVDYTIPNCGNWHTDSLISDFNDAYRKVETKKPEQNPFVSPRWSVSLRIYNLILLFPLLTLVAIVVGVMVIRWILTGG